MIREDVIFCIRGIKPGESSGSICSRRTVQGNVGNRNGRYSIGNIRWPRSIGSITSPRIRNIKVNTIGSAVILDDKAVRPSAIYSILYDEIPIKGIIMQSHNIGDVSIISPI